MTTPQPTATRPATARRQRLVNAALVGTVVVVLGFASGIGVTTSTSATQASPPQQPQVSSTPQSTPATSPGRPPINYIGVAIPQPGAAAAPVVSARVTTSVPTPAPSTGSSSTGSAPPTVTPHPTSPGSPSSAGCPPNVLGGLLNSVLTLLAPSGSNQSGSGLLPLVSGLLGSSSGSSPLGAVLNLLGGGKTAPAMASSLPVLSPGTSSNDLLAMVGDLLPGVLAGLGPAGSSRTASAGLTAACSSSLLGKLALIGATG